MARRLELHSWDGLPETAERGRNWALVQGDCVEALEKLPPHSVDVAFADPPYMLSNGGSTCQGGKRVSVDKGSWDASRGLSADHAFQMRWLEAVRRVLKPSGTLWVSGTQHVIFSIGFAMQEMGYHLLNTVTWYKPNASPNLACRFFTHSTELLLWASPAKLRPLAHRFNYKAMKHANGGKQMRDLWAISEPPVPGGEQVIWSLPTPGPKEKVHGRHPTQKPLGLLERVVAASAAEGDLVLDPFSGSATTGVAALRAGCRFVGIERDPTYLDLGARRLRAAEALPPADASLAVRPGALAPPRPGRGFAMPLPRGPAVEMLGRGSTPCAAPRPLRRLPHPGSRGRSLTVRGPPARHPDEQREQLPAVEGTIADADELKPGDRVVYPNQGVCAVVGVEEKDIAGQKLQLVRMRREEDGAAVLVPKNKVPSIGLRRVATGAQMEGVFHYLAAQFDDPELDWKVRHRDNADRLIAGGVLGVAEVVKGLHSLSRIRPLPTKEREQYDNARHLLVHEIAVSLGVPAVLAEDYVDFALMPPAGVKFDLKPPPTPVMLPSRPKKRRPAAEEEEDDLGLGDLGIDIDLGAALEGGAAIPEGEVPGAEGEEAEGAEAPAEGEAAAAEPAEAEAADAEAGAEEPGDSADAADEGGAPGGDEAGEEADEAAPRGRAKAAKGAKGAEKARSARPKPAATAKPAARKPAAKKAAAKPAAKPAPKRGGKKK